MPFLRSIQLSDAEANLEWGDGKEKHPSLERQLVDMCMLHYDMPEGAPVTMRIHRFDKTRTLFLPPQPLSTEPANTAQVALFIGSPLRRAGVLKVFRRNLDRELLPVEQLASAQAILVEVQAFTSTMYYALDGEGMDEETFLLFALFNVNGRRQKVSNCSLSDIASSSSLRAAQEDFIESSFTQLSLPTLLNDTLYQDLRALPTASWCMVGPYDYRHWYDCPLERLSLGGGSALESLRDLLLGDTFRIWIGQLSGLELGGLQDISLRKITRRCFQIFNEQYEEPSGLEVVLSVMTAEPTDASHGNGGSWIYLVDGEQVAEITPQNGILSMAYRIDGCNRFLSYVPGESSLCLYQFHLLFKVIGDDANEEKHEKEAGC